MIKTFKNKQTERLFHGFVGKGLALEIARAAQRKLKVLHNAISLNDLRVPPGNCLESLCGDRSGQYSIRVNDQWRICFFWRENNAYDVEFVDYH